MTKTILVLVSNPRGTTVLDLSRGIPDIKEGLKRSQNRNQFKIEICVAVRPLDLRRTIMEIKLKLGGNVLDLLFCSRLLNQIPHD